MFIHGLTTNSLTSDKGFPSQGAQEHRASRYSFVIYLLLLQNGDLFVLFVSSSLPAPTPSRLSTLAATVSVYQQERPKLQAALGLSASAGSLERDIRADKSAREATFRSNISPLSSE
jgi:hypothetical protein